MQRDKAWLNLRLQKIWQRYFPDLKQANRIYLGFGRKARTRLGSIKYHRLNKTSTITLSGYFQNPEIPDFVVDGVLAHELVHYLHGFASPHPRLSHYPHQGGVVDKELKSRGLEDLLTLEKKWIKKYHAKYFR